VQARRAAVTTGGPAPAPPIPIAHCIEGAMGTPGSPIRSGLFRQPEAVGPRAGRRCAHQRGSPARSRLPRPDGLVRASRLRPRLEGLGAEGRRPGEAHGRGGQADPLLRASSPVAVRSATGTRHSIHLIFSGGGRLGWPSLRASSPVAIRKATGTRHSIHPCPELINPECAVREHNGQPCRSAPLS
jgi:hypothetical protein